MGKKSTEKKGTKKVVRRDIARQYDEYRDLKEALGDGLPAYRKLAGERPQDLDVSALAATLSGLVQFRKAAAAMLLAYIEGDEGAAIPAFASFREGIRAAKGGSRIIAACETHGCVDMLAQALVFLFIDEHQRGLDIDTGMDALPEEKDSGSDLPDEAPEGYPSDDSAEAEGEDET